MIDYTTKLRKEVEVCIECGFCEAVCPTFSSSGFLPSYGARGRIILARNLIEKNSSSKFRELSSSFMSCLNCFACLHVCPAGVNAGAVSSYARQLINGSTPTKGTDPLIRMILNLTEKFENPLGIQRQMSSWVDSSDVSFSNDSSILLYTGSMYQITPYLERLQRMRGIMGESLTKFFASLIARFPTLSLVFKLLRDRKSVIGYENSLASIVKLLNSSGVVPRYLGASEPYPGTLLHDLGYSENFKRYAERVTSRFKDMGIRKIITVDPHTYDLLRNIYPDYVRDFNFEVYHYLEFIDMKQFTSSQESIVLHEPCHLVLHSSSSDFLHDVLDGICETKYPRRHGSRTECCGGPDELLFPDLSSSISRRRLKNLEDVGGSKIVTACPICETNLNLHGNVIDLADFLVQHHNTLRFSARRPFQRK